MTPWTLIRRSLVFHARAHFGVVLGAAIGSAALTGALVVGDSVRESLREKALQRLANATATLTATDGFFTRQLAQSSCFSSTVPSGSGTAGKPASSSAGLLSLPGSAWRTTIFGRANHVQVYGVPESFWALAGAPAPAAGASDTVWLNRNLAHQLGAAKGDEIILRVPRPGWVSLEAAVVQRKDRTVAAHLTVAGILPSNTGGDLSFRSGGGAQQNAFVDLDTLSKLTGAQDQLNLLLWHSPAANPAPDELTQLEEQVRRCWTLADAALTVRELKEMDGIELRSPRVFLPAAVAGAVGKVETNAAIGVLTYLANLISAGTNATPYSMITAAGPPYTPADLKDDEIRVSQWLADDLQLHAGDSLQLVYFLPESGAAHTEATNVFRVRDIVPLSGLYADKTLMPDFPGIDKAESTRDWDAGFPLVHHIRPKDEKYWSQHRGTPKAFVSLAAGQRLWGNRFGNLTAIRLANAPGENAAQHRERLRRELVAQLHPGEVGLRLDPVREQALRAASQSQDFGQLFLGFSFFLVLAALLLMALLFQFGVEQRMAETGTLLALGFRAAQVRRLFWREGIALAAVGGVLGALGGVAYAFSILCGLTSIWRGAIGAAQLGFHVTATSLITGAASSTVVAAITIWLTLRRQARRPVTELLREEHQLSGPRSSRWAKWIAIGSGVTAASLLIWLLVKGDRSNAGAFFGAGALWLVTGLALMSVWLAALQQAKTASQLSLVQLGIRGCVRRRPRSVSTMALLACGSFLIVAIGAFRLDANRDASLRTAGTGGFALIGEATQPVVEDLNSEAGRDAFGLSEKEMKSVQVVPLRLREGDDASCLNLNRAQRPQLLGVNPRLLTGRFTFVETLPSTGVSDPWSLLRTSGGDEVPAIGDANAIEWALGKKLGDTLDYTDENGRSFKVRLVGAVANSILQGSLLIDEAAFVKKFPGQSGYRMFFIDAPKDSLDTASETLSKALQDFGLDLTSAASRLNAFNAVQNTYLGTFQVLGGLGLLLGSAGLGVVVLRNVLERRGELGLLTAVGFRRRSLFWLLLSEHGALLCLGLLLGLAAAAIAVWPSLLTPGNEFPYRSLAWTLGGVWLNGVLWTWLATRWALRGRLLNALVNE